MQSDATRHSTELISPKTDSDMRGPIVAVGASGGGVQALLQVVGSLPADFRAPVMVVVHIGNRLSLIPQLLDHACPLTAAYADHDEPIVPGRIYMAPPDRHLLVEHGRTVLSSGPRENHFRPAINPLFQSVAAAYGLEAIGVILSGALTDGVVGLAAIKSHGGTTIVQDPTDALISGMPASALADVAVDYVLRAGEIGERLCLLVNSTSPAH